MQRDGNGLKIRALATGTALDLATVTDPAARALLDRLDAANVDVVVKIGFDRLRHPQLLRRRH